MQKRACAGFGVEHDPHVASSASQITLAHIRIAPFFHVPINT